MDVGVVVVFVVGLLEVAVGLLVWALLVALLVGVLDAAFWLRYLS